MLYFNTLIFLLVGIALYFGKHLFQLTMCILVSATVTSFVPLAFCVSRVGRKGISHPKQQPSYSLYSNR